MSRPGSAAVPRAPGTFATPGTAQPAAVGSIAVGGNSHRQARSHDSRLTPPVTWVDSPMWQQRPCHCAFRWPPFVLSLTTLPSARLARRPLRVRRSWLAPPRAACHPWPGSSARGGTAWLVACLRVGAPSAVPRRSLFLFLPFFFLVGYSGRSSFHSKKAATISASSSLCLLKTHQHRLYTLKQKQDRSQDSLAESGWDVSRGQN